MLVAFFGTDVVGVRQRAHECIATYEEKGMTVDRITPENYVAGSIEDAAGSVSLFAGVQVYVLDTPSGDTEMFEQAFGMLDMLKESDNTFVLIEEGLLAAQKKSLQKYAEKCVELEGKKEERFNTFSLTDALLRRDKKSLWILLMRAKREGISSEEIIVTLHWQMKTLRLAGRTKNADEAGLKPFVYGKAQKASQLFKEGEIDSLSHNLVSLYHEGHLGIRDMDISLERWVLGI